MGMVIRSLHRLILPAALLASLLAPVSGPAQYGSPAPRYGPRAPHAAVAREILLYVNQFRRSKGLSPLEANSYISSVALGHSRDMLTGKSPFGHDGFRNRIDLIRHHLGRLHVAAENVASGPMGAREVVDGWLNSPGHRLNIEGDFRLTGIGVAEAPDGMVYFTQIFVK